jgi:hypothetical protein
MSTTIGVAQQIEEAKREVGDWPAWMTSSYRRDKSQSASSKYSAGDAASETVQAPAKKDQKKK